MPDNENDNLIYHRTCGLPLELCVCDGPNTIKKLTPVECGLCGGDFISVHPPGVPISDMQCVKCRKFGALKLQTLNEDEF